MLGAVAAGPATGGYGSFTDAVSRMATPPSQVYEPVEERRRQYDVLYEQYRRLYDDFGRRRHDVMSMLRTRRAEREGSHF